MIQVKEFLNYQDAQETKMNEWLEEQRNAIEVIDIKYSVGLFSAEDSKGWDAKEFSGALVIYRVKGS